jgi:hypothetical protein
MTPCRPNTISKALYLGTGFYMRRTALLCCLEVPRSPDWEDEVKSGLPRAFLIHHGLVSTSDNDSPPGGIIELTIEISLDLSQSLSFHYANTISVPTLQ